MSEKDMISTSFSDTLTSFYLYPHSNALIKTCIHPPKHMTIPANTVRFEDVASTPTDNAEYVMSSIRHDQMLSNSCLQPTTAIFNQQLTVSDVSPNNIICLFSLPPLYRRYNWMVGKENDRVVRV